ncbi:MAG: hypothetical protein ACK517_02945 [bacterium]
MWYAFVDGKQGTTYNYATGLSFYPRSAQHLKISIDTTYIDGSPVNSTGSDILVGDDGPLVRTQFHVVFTSNDCVSKQLPQNSRLPLPA